MSVYTKGTVNKIMAGFTVFNFKGDLGANFGSVTDQLDKFPLTGNAPFAFAIMENTNATGAAVWFYVYAPGTGWKHAVLS